MTPEERLFVFHGYKCYICGCICANDDREYYSYHWHRPTGESAIPKRLCHMCGAVMDSAIEKSRRVYEELGVYDTDSKCCKCDVCIRKEGE